VKLSDYIFPGLVGIYATIGFGWFAGQIACLSLLAIISAIKELKQ
jgi:hypothetical protein